jgi:uncharacterized protein (DUF488 family)
MPRANELKLPSTSQKRQVQNKEVWNSSRSVETADFFTLGYSGRPLKVILQILEERGIRTLVDIRTNPVSMYRPELSKNNLRMTLEEQSIVYDHRPQFGVPRDIRAKAIASGNRDVIWEWYDKHVADAYVGINLHRFFNTIEHPVVLMCSELDPLECHRHRLCLSLERLGLKGFDL